MPEIAEDGPLPVAELARYVRDGRAWVTVDDVGVPAAYLITSAPPTRRRMTASSAGRLRPAPGPSGPRLAAIRGPRPGRVHRLSAPGRDELRPAKRASLMRAAPECIPAVEQRREGIFLQLREDMVAAWAATKCAILIRGGPQPDAIRYHIDGLHATGFLHRL